MRKTIKNKTGIIRLNDYTLSHLIPVILIASINPAIADDDDIIFYDIAKMAKTGISYERQPSLSNALWEEIRVKKLFTPFDMVFSPTKPRGMPGVASFDYDNDGDIDIYVTNGPGANNSLYENMYTSTGEVKFRDVAVKSGVGAKDYDSSGVCFGDINNDGYQDLYVLSKNAENRLFVNNGDGHFSDMTDSYGLGAGNMASTSCSFGDVNGDGMLDVVIANIFYENEILKAPIVMPGFEHLLQHNQLFVNTGNNQYKDMSKESGINTEKGISWSIALVDYDLDGDLDLVVADDHGAKRPAYLGGADTGMLRMYSNNGSGVFTDVTEHLNGGRFGAWMSLSFGDLNHDGYMDIFASNIGSYMAMFMQVFVDYPVEHDRWETGWFTGNKDGGFDFVNNSPNLQALPFGWGSAITDYDNDGDQDIIYHGGLDMGMFADAGNPGSVLNNDGDGEFSRDSEALTTDHSRRNVQGMSIADLNNDGFIDIISASNMNWPSTEPLAPYFKDDQQLLGGEFDDSAYYTPTFTAVDPNNLPAGATWNGIDQENGTLVVEMSSADSDNSSVRVKLLGTKGMTVAGRVNRDGIGAVVMFKPRKGEPVLSPVVSGGVYASQHSMIKNFGMGEANKGIVEVLWPGGKRNRLYGVKAGEMVVFPEIPCSFDDKSLSRNAYKNCVSQHLVELVSNNVIDIKAYRRLFFSAMRAYGKKDIYGINNDVTFTDESDEIEFVTMTIDSEGMSGAAWFDYDNDNDLDLYLTNGIGSENALFRNDGKKGFVNVSEQAGVSNGGGNSGVLAGDIDNDGYADLFLSSEGGMVTPIKSSDFKLYHNNQDGTFSDISSTSGITGLITSFTSSFGDVNNDGYLDLLVSTPGSIPLQRQDRNKLYINNGDLTFTDISAQAGIDTALGGCLTSFVDYDNDMDQDIVIGNCNDIRFIQGPIELFRNDGNNSFTNVTQQAGLHREGGWMGLAIGDYDNDGDQDMFSSNLGALPMFPREVTGSVFYENNGDGTFSDVSIQTGTYNQIWGWGVSFADYNNDGYLDLLQAGSFPFMLLPSVPNPGILYINNKDKTFNDKSELLGIDLSDAFTSSVSSADYNLDGFNDVIITGGPKSVDGSLDGERIPGKPVLLKNNGNNNYSVTIKTIGTVSNADGIGAKVVVKSGKIQQTREVRAGSSFLATESKWLVFGVNRHDEVDSIDVYWPSGIKETYYDIDANQFIEITENKGIKTTSYKKINRKARHYDDD